MHLGFLIIAHIAAAALPAGMGARELAADPDCFAIRGQVRRVRCPPLKHCAFLDDSFYILPNHNFVVVGGTQQRGDEREAVSEGDSARIWEVATGAWPALRGAEILSDWVRAGPDVQL